jgi:hypothetical protein
MPEKSTERNNSSNHSTSVILDNAVNLDNAIGNNEVSSILDCSQIISKDLDQDIRYVKDNSFMEIEDVVIHMSTMVNAFTPESVFIVNKSSNLTSHFSCDDVRSFLPENKDVSCINCLNKSNNKSQARQEIEAGVHDNNEPTCNNNSVSSEQKSLDGADDNINCVSLEQKSPDVAVDYNISKDLNGTERSGKIVGTRLLSQFESRNQRRCKECGQSKIIFAQ